MNKKHLFDFLKDQSPLILIEFLEKAYDEMDTDQRNAAFGEARKKKAEPPAVHGRSLLEKVQQFQRESLAVEYYAPFDINSKNYMHIPEKTKAWFERLGDLLAESARLSRQGGHAQAVACFRVLYELIDKLRSGEEIVFADECGTWMIPVNEKKIIPAYLKSLAATATPQEYAASVLPLIRRDACESFTKDAYSAAVRAATKTQRAFLQAEVERLKIRTKSEKW